MRSTTGRRSRAQIDEAVLCFQASVFNGCWRIYAPRYRQASLRAICNDAESYAADELAYDYSEGRNQPISAPLSRLTAAACQNGQLGGLLGVSPEPSEARLFSDCCLTMGGIYHDFDYGLVLHEHPHQCAAESGCLPEDPRSRALAGGDLPALSTCA